MPLHISWTVAEGFSILPNIFCFSYALNITSQCFWIERKVFYTFTWPRWLLFLCVWYLLTVHNFKGRDLFVCRDRFWRERFWRGNAMAKWLWPLRILWTNNVICIKVCEPSFIDCDDFLNGRNSKNVLRIICILNCNLSNFLLVFVLQLWLKYLKRMMCGRIKPIHSKMKIKHPKMRTHILLHNKLNPKRFLH